MMMTGARMMSIDELKASLASSILRGMMVSPLDGNGACGCRDCGLPLGGGKWYVYRPIESRRTRARCFWRSFSSRWGLRSGNWQIVSTFPISV